ncbi:MAG: DUF1828 domain-containing protein [Anaerolineae bacterium]|nr:DUF1828 domain-containing protein [Anaerolineae bacterium]
MSDREECPNIIEEYVNHLGGRFVVRRRDDGACRVTTPYWRSDGDLIEFFAYVSPDGYITLTDQGQTFDWLFLNGAAVEGNATREELAKNLAGRYDVTLENGVFSTEATLASAGQTVHNFLTVLQTASHLILLRQQRAKRIFKADVELYLLEHEQIYKPKYVVEGKTTEHIIDFYLNSERRWLVKALENGSESNIHRTVFQWIDIRRAGQDYEMVTVLDDSKDKWEKIWSDEKILRPLEEYSDHLIRWSQRVRLIAPTGEATN